MQTTNVKISMQELKAQSILRTWSGPVPKYFGGGKSQNKNRNIREITYLTSVQTHMYSVHIAGIKINPGDNRCKCLPRRLNGYGSDNTTRAFPDYTSAKGVSGSVGRGVLTSGVLAN